MVLQRGSQRCICRYFPIEDSAHKWALHFGDYYFGQGKYNIEQCKAKDVNYSAPLYVKVRLENKETGELKEHDLFMGISQS